MTDNPYEPPQTIDSPTRLPLAEEVLVTTVDYAALAEAAAGCATAGKCYLIAACLTAAELIIIVLPKELLWRGLAILIFVSFVASLIAVSIGVFWNTIACWQFKLELPDPKLRRLYASCRTASWLKAAMGGMLVIFAFSPYQPNSLWYFLGWFVPTLVLIVNSLHTVILHFRGLNELGAMLETTAMDRPASVYLFVGLPTTVLGFLLLVISLSTLRGAQFSTIMLVVLAIVLPPTFVAYWFAYARLNRAFRDKMVQD